MMKRDRGEGRVFLRGKTWWIQYGHRGQDYRESSKSGERKVAVRLLRARLSEIHAGKHAPASERVDLGELRTLFETDHRLAGRRAKRQPARAWDALEDYFGSRVAVDITKKELTAYADARQKEGAAPATFAYELAILRRGFVLAVEQGILHQRPSFPTIRVSNTRTGWASEADVQALLKELAPPLRGPVSFAY
jgi:hypothetical protein